MNMNKPTADQFLQHRIEHVDITAHDPTAMIQAMSHMAFTARDLARAADILKRMIADPNASVILCLAGSLISAGLKKVFVEMIRNRMVDAVVSTGANIVDQDFFEGLGFNHYIADEYLKAGTQDDTLRRLGIDRIYDTLISEEDLRICDETIQKIADNLPAGVYSSRRFIQAMGQYLDQHHSQADSIVLEAYRMDVPIFCPAFSDCSAGFGLVAHQAARSEEDCLTIDSVRDFHELTRIKIQAGETGLFMIGGGVPKNFAQDVVVAADILGREVPMHRYAVQVTVADVRDGALSGSTLKEACSWGKVDLTDEQMVYSEATLAVPLLAGYAYHSNVWQQRTARRHNLMFEPVTTA